MKAEASTQSALVQKTSVEFLEDNLRMNCLPVGVSMVLIRGPTGSCGVGFCTQEALTKLTRSPRDPLVVYDNGSAHLSYSATLKDLQEALFIYLVEEWM